MLRREEQTHVFLLVTVTGICLFQKQRCGVRDVDKVLHRCECITESRAWSFSYFNEKVE